MSKLVDRVLRVGEGRRLRTLEHATRAVNALEPQIEALSDAELKEHYVALRERVASAEDAKRELDATQAECFALVREAGRRALGMRQFDVQIMGGFALAD